MTSSSEGEILQAAQVIRDRWKIKQKIGGGGFGEIYEAIDLQNHNERVAVKVESSKATKQVLKMEVAVLRRLQGKKHACKFYGCGRNDRFNYLVMSLQGKNLADLRRESPKQCFSVSTALRLGLQILNGIREIHSIGFLHRAKYEALGQQLGFAVPVRYAAVSAHKNKEMGRQDDLWSLFYMLAEFLQGSLPWRRIKDKDEVGRMKDEVDVIQLLDGCPEELHQFPAHLKTLMYPDEPNYDMLELCLKTAMARLEVQMDDPYDWELGYENISGRSKGTSGTTANASTRMRSHTTAVRGQGPENRALDTQAPITMGEDDDEQTGNYYKLPPPAKSTHDTDGQDQDKPKYKRQEFMRPKYGAVSFDVIDAVNARLAAASSGSVQDIFSKMKVDTSVENDPNALVQGRDIEVNVELPAHIASRAPGADANGTNGIATEQRHTLARQPSQEQKNSKSNRSITLSTGKRYQNGSRRHPSTTANSTNAVAEDDPAQLSYHKGGQTIISKWHDSFDDSAGDDHMHVERSMDRDYSGNKSPIAPRYG
ncbi:Protein R90.1 [Aphelenchoides avenae]|nr:Protein R90.1 [Aphelenchus avenae]